MNAFLVVQTFYWIALSTWFGGVLFLALVAPVVFRTLNESRPILPHVLSVNLENQHSSLLSGQIVGNMLKALGPVQIGCAGVLLVMLVAQWLVMDRSTTNVMHAVARSCLFVAAVGLSAYERYVVWPKVWKWRDEYIEHADEPEVANPAKEQFDRYHQEAMRVLFFVLIILSLMIVFSSMVTANWSNL